MLRDLHAVFSEWPEPFGVLDEIVAQFRTNSGHSMRDVLNRLETAAEVSATASGRLVKTIGLLDVKVTLSAATGLRNEEHAEVAAGLAAGVAADLATAHEQADAVAAGANPGEAADAASRSPLPTEDVSTTDPNGEPNERP